MTSLKFDVIMGLIVMLFIAILSYGNRYTPVSDHVVQKGIIFKNTLDLNKYEKIGEGTGIFGSYELYKFKNGSTKPIEVYR